MTGSELLIIHYNFHVELERLELRSARLGGWGSDGKVKRGGFFPSQQSRRDRRDNFE